MGYVFSGFFPQCTSTMALLLFSVSSLSDDRGIFTLLQVGDIISQKKNKKNDEENHQKANRWRQPPCATTHCQRSTMKGRKELNAIEQRDTNTAPGQVHAMNSAHGGRRGMSARCSSSMLFCLCPRRLRSRHPERFWVCARVKPHHSYWP